MSVFLEVLQDISCSKCYVNFSTFCLCQQMKASSAVMKVPITILQSQHRYHDWSTDEKTYGSCQAIVVTLVSFSPYQSKGLVLGLPCT